MSRERRWARAGGLLLVVAAVFSSPDAAAQAAIAKGSPATVQLSLNGAFTSAIQINIEGSIDLNGNDTTLISGSGTTGVVNFGTYDLTTPLLTGQKHPVAGQSKGTYLVATLTVSVVFAGGFTSAAVDISRVNPTGPAPDVPQSNLFYAFMQPQNARARNQKLVWPKWQKYPQDPRAGVQVYQVPAAGHVPGSGNLDNGMASGDALDHQIAVFIPATQQPGPFSTLVAYTATAF